MTDETIDRYYESQLAQDSDYAEYLQSLEDEKVCGVIYYGFGKDYLSNWGVKEALREIYQNFIDYGDYESSFIEENDTIKVFVKNSWNPETLEFLRIGNSQKNGNQNAIGKHGEGVKMAFLVLLREGYKCQIFTPKFYITPDFYIDKEIGLCFCFKYEIHKEIIDTQFEISFECDKNIFEEFNNNIIKNEDIIFSDNYWGEIVDKEQGNIYCGRLFVANVDNISKSFNIHPAHMVLDRDRCAPRSFDVNYAASKINQSYGKLTAKDFTYNDTQYIDHIPDDIKKEFKPTVVGNSIEFKFEENGETKILTNSSVKDSLIGSNFFKKAIDGIKRFIAKKLGVYDLLIEFQKKHSAYLNTEGKRDLEIILEKVKD